ncbi:HHLA1 protein, partial [Sula dactylatra]|nr:HHLA1 protein [Sula dactylatra]
IMQWFCWHVPVKMSLAFLCLFLVCNTEHCLVPRQRKLFLSLFLQFTASCIRRENKKEKQVAVLATAELPAKSVDLAAINLTELVNGMLNTALRGNKKLFSLLSVTSYSSFAFHKVSVTIYNISNVKNVDPGKFPMHYCYCLNNVTNDLTDFTALLVDIVGNSTSYLTEIFKSTSILSVRQSNDSDCIYICVMTGQAGKNLSEFWEVLEKSPVINYTFSSNTSSDLDLIFSSFMKLQEDPNKTADPLAEHVWTFKTRCWCPPSVSPASPATSNPFAQGGQEIPITRFPPWPMTVEAKGTGFPSPHVDAFNMDWLLENLKMNLFQNKISCFKSPYWYKENYYVARIGHLSACDNNVVISNRKEKSCSSTPKVHVKGTTSSCKLCPFTAWSLIIFSETQHGICRDIPYFSECWCRGDIRLEGLLYAGDNTTCIHAAPQGCPQAILKESHVTSPPATLIVQKINPCVMELCRFFQLCLCVGQRRYSRKEAMRYCVEYYSWFLKNASYVCKRVKRVAYSHTLKQKCLKNICTSV